jgi:hypothetical protein
MSKKKLQRGNFEDGSAFQRSTQFQADLEKFIEAVQLRSNSKKFSCLFEFPALRVSINAQARKWTYCVSGLAVRKKLCVYSKKEAKNGRA